MDEMSEYIRIVDGEASLTIDQVLKKVIEFHVNSGVTMTRAATNLGIGRSTLYRMMERHEVPRHRRAGRVKTERHPADPVSKETLP